MHYGLTKKEFVRWLKRYREIYAVGIITKWELKGKIRSLTLNYKDYLYYNKVKNNA